MGARRDDKQISGPVYSPEIFIRARLFSPGTEGIPPPWIPLDSHLCPPASVDERADRLVRPRPTGVEVGAVPGFYQPHKVGTFALQGEELVSTIVSSVTAKGSERAGCRQPRPPVVLSLSSDTPLFSWRTPASGSGGSTEFRVRGRQQARSGKAGGGSTHYERLLVHVVHVQSDQVLPAAQVQPTLVLVHQEDAIVAGVEGEAEGSRCLCIRQLWGEQTRRHLRGQRSLSHVLDMFPHRLDELLPVPRTTAFSLVLLKMCVAD